MRFYKIKLDTDQLFLTKEYITDGKLLLTWAYAMQFKELHKYASMKHGTYNGNTHMSDDTPDVKNMVHGYTTPEYIQKSVAVRLTADAVRRGVHGYAIRCVSAEFPMYVQDRYAAALEDKSIALSTTGDRSPVLMFDGEKFAGLLMPLRLDRTALDNFEFPAKESKAGAT